MSHHLVKTKLQGHGRHAGGRPPHYDDPAVLQAKIDEYFEKGINHRRVIVGPPNKRDVVLIPVPTITGLVAYLGFADRHSFYAYEKLPKFSHTIKAARNRIQQVYEEQLQTPNASGAIFALKNFGWSDRQEIDYTGQITVGPLVSLPAAVGIELPPGRVVEEEAATTTSCRRAGSSQTR